MICHVSDTHLLQFLDEFDRVRQVLHLLGALVRNINAKLLLDLHDHLDNIQTVSAEIGGKVGIVGNLALFNAKLLRDDANKFGLNLAWGGRTTTHAGER